MATVAQPILVPTAEKGATTTMQAPMVTFADDRMADVSGVAQAVEGLGIEPTALADQLSAFVAHERCGVHLYRSVAGRTEVDELRRTYEQFGEETLRHVEIYTNVIEALGGDPLYVSPAARATEKANSELLQTTFMITGSADPATRELSMIEAVAIAETKCHANWELMVMLSRALPDGPVRQAMEAAVAEVKPQEDEHLAWATTARQRFLLNLVAPGIDFGPAEAEMVALVSDDESLDAVDPAELTGTEVDAVEADAELAEVDESEAEEIAAEDLEAMSKSELYERAQELDIPGRSSMKKDELVEAVRDAEEE